MDRSSDSAEPKRVVEEGYDRVAHHYARLEGATDWPRLRWLQKVLIRLHPGASVLDLGCGSGDPADVVIAQAHQVTGVDISQTQLILARQNVPTGTFLHSDVGSVEFPAGSFDAAISFYTLEHIPRAEHGTILQRIAQWLRPNGLLLVSIEAADYNDVIGEWLGVPMFLSCFEPEVMQRLVTEAGFAVLESEIETQLEQDHEVPYLWVLAQKR
jgi:ubiquinone/menaquinone biosynthesis C-methylase UbiE